MQTKVFPRGGRDAAMEQVPRRDMQGRPRARRLHAPIVRLFRDGPRFRAQGLCARRARNERQDDLCKVVRILLGEYGLVSSAKIVSATYDKHDTVFAALEKKRFVEIPEIDRSLCSARGLRSLPATTA